VNERESWNGRISQRQTSTLQMPPRALPALRTQFAELEREGRDAGATREVFKALEGML
jgi:hypothetical protein